MDEIEGNRLKLSETEQFQRVLSRMRAEEQYLRKKMYGDIKKRQSPTRKIEGSFLNKSKGLPKKESYPEQIKKQCLACVRVLGMETKKPLKTKRTMLTKIVTTVALPPKKFMVQDKNNRKNVLGMKGKTGEKKILFPSSKVKKPQAPKCLACQNNAKPRRKPTPPERKKEEGVVAFIAERIDSDESSNEVEVSALPKISEPGPSTSFQKNLSETGTSTSFQRSVSKPGPSSLFPKSKLKPGRTTSFPKSSKPGTSLSFLKRLSKPGISTSFPKRLPKPGTSTSFPKRLSKPGASSSFLKRLSKPGVSTSLPKSSRPDASSSFSNRLSKPGTSKRLSNPVLSSLSPKRFSKPGTSSSLLKRSSKPGTSTSSPKKLSRPGASTSFPKRSSKPGTSTSFPKKLSKPGTSTSSRKRFSNPVLPSLSPKRLPEPGPSSSFPMRSKPAAKKVFPKKMSKPDPPKRDLSTAFPLSKPAPPSSFLPSPSKPSPSVSSEPEVLRKPISLSLSLCELVLRRGSRVREESAEAERGLFRLAPRKVSEVDMACQEAGETRSTNPMREAMLKRRNPHEKFFRLNEDCQEQTINQT